MVGLAAFTTQPRKQADTRPNCLRHLASYLLLHGSDCPLPDAIGNVWRLQIYFVERAADPFDALSQLRLRRWRRLKLRDPVDQGSVPTAHAPMRLDPLAVLEIGLQPD